MKKLIVIAIICVIGYTIFFKIGSADKQIVAYGDTESNSNTGIQEISIDGPFNAEEIIEPGLPTIIYFYTKRCPACVQINGDAQKLIKFRPDVAVKKIRLDDYWTKEDALNTYKIEINFTPWVMVYGPDQKLIEQNEGDDNAGQDFFYKWLKFEINRDWKEKQQNA